jgi:hypothetical protein
LFKLGDKVEIQIAKVDRFKRQVDFKLADNGRPALSGRGRGDKRRPGRDQSR